MSHVKPPSTHHNLNISPIKTPVIAAEVKKLQLILEPIKWKHLRFFMLVPCREFLLVLIRVESS
jgi:hypothetical protein